MSNHPMIHAHALPPHALLARYASAGAFTDCYATDVPAAITHAEYVEAFYTTALFKIERLLLAWLISKPSSDAQARQLATGAINAFAAWTVEERSVDQLLLRAIDGRTRSWLMVAPVADGAGTSTRLYFGSAVVPVVNKAAGQARMGFVFRALLSFHKLYSRALLRSASSRLARSRATRR